MSYQDPFFGIVEPITLVTGFIFNGRGMACDQGRYIEIVQGPKP